MLKRWMHGRERALSRRDNRRRVYPFSWGVEHLLSDGSTHSIFDHHPASNGFLASDGAAELKLAPREFLHWYCERAIAASDQFFSAPPTAEYELRGDHLTFPSAVRTPFEENNTVHARLFPARSRGRAVLVLPQWNADPHSHVALCRLLGKVGITALRLSLPYHNERRPPELLRPEYLVSANIGLTLQANRQAVLDVRRAADWLEQQGYRRLGIMGTSIGSCIAFLALAHDERLGVGVFNHASSYFADVVWTGISTQHVRQGLEPAIDLAELRQLWAVLSPQTFIRRLRDRRLKGLVISGRYDLSFLPDLTGQVIQEFHRHEVKVDWLRLPCGHYTLGHFPFNYLDGLIVTNYLRRHLRGQQPAHGLAGAGHPAG